MKKIYSYLLTALMALAATATMTSCHDSSDQYESDILTSGDWQGYLGEYYYDRWGISGTTYETTMRFTSRGVGSTSGRGYEVDYDTRTPFYDYAYCEFSWSIVEGVITIIYDDSQWQPVYISRYTLNSDYFAGYMNDGTRRDIRFEFHNVRFGYWDTYRSYFSRTRSGGK
jgi:hypothetical protein